MNYTEKDLKERALSEVIEELKDGFSGYYSDLHYEVFNTTYFIIGTYKAERALEEYGTFDAIGTVSTYMKDNFGEIDADTILDPEKLVNMLYYIIGEGVISDIIDNSPTFRDNYDNVADGEINAKIIEELTRAVIEFTK